MLKSKFARAVLSQLPVVGPHAAIEAELLLSGQKPIGFISRHPDSYRPVERNFGLLDDEDLARLRQNLKRIYYEIEMQGKLDDQVAKGNLKSVDVIYPSHHPDQEPRINRFYCQPEHEKMMHFVADIHQKLGDRQPLSESELNHLKKKDIGLHLGYRKRDVLLFSLINGGKMSRFIPDAVINFVCKTSSNLGKPAFQEALLEEAREKCSKKGIPLQTQIPKPRM